MLAVRKAAVRGDEPQRVEVACAVLGILGRRRTADARLDDGHDRVPEPDAAADPLVLLVRADADDGDEHAEAAAVDRAVVPGLTLELLERGLREQRDHVLVEPAALRVHAEEAQRLADELRERSRERPLDHVRGAPGVPQVDDLGRAEPDLVLNDGAVRKAQREPLGVASVLGDYGHHSAVADPAEEAACLVQHEELPVPGHAGPLDHDLVGVVLREPLDRGDREAGDDAHVPLI